MASEKQDVELCPADRMEGIVLDGGWKIEAKIEKTPTQTGAFFSRGYVARNEDGRVAFLKALDFSRALQYADPSRALEKATRAFNFERDLLDLCKDKNMTKIVRAIGSGIVKVDDSPVGRVQYLLFEPAEGDLRKAISSFRDIQLFWCLNILHQTAVGLEQLHAQQIAHQDLKPSNILLFDNAFKSAKLSDLGCASIKGTESPRDDKRIPGAWTYAPPELLYGQLSEDWNVRRLASDIYQLGNLAAFLFSGITVSQLIAMYTPTDFRPLAWKGSYGEVLAVIRDAFGRSIEQLRGSFEGEIEGSILEIIRELCEPDPALRGHRKSGSGSTQYSVRPYVSRFANLRARSELSLRKIKRS